MSRNWSSHEAVGHLVFQEREAKIRGVAAVSQVPMSMTDQYLQAEKLAGLELALKAEPAKGIAARMEGFLGNHQIVSKQAEMMFGIKYENPWDALYAISYAALISLLKAHIFIEQAAKSADQKFREMHPDFLIVPNWLDLLRTVREVLSREEDVPWYLVNDTIAAEKGWLTEDEMRQCSFFAGSPAYGEEVYRQAEDVFIRFESLLSQSMAGICHLLGRMKYIEETGVLDQDSMIIDDEEPVAGNVEAVEQRIQMIELQVEQSFQSHLN